MAKFILYGFLFYLLYKFITQLVMPVGKASQQMKQKMQEMQDRQEAFQQRLLSPIYLASTLSFL